MKRASEKKEHGPENSANLHAYITPVDMCFQAEKTAVVPQRGISEIHVIRANCVSENLGSICENYRRGALFTNIIRIPSWKLRTGTPPHSAHRMQTKRM